MIKAPRGRIDKPTSARKIPILRFQPCARPTADAAGAEPLRDDAFQAHAAACGRAEPESAAEVASNEGTPETTKPTEPPRKFTLKKLATLQNGGRLFWGLS